jgi:hypothetical protein
MALPTNGQLNWGTPLNAEITADEATIASTLASLQNHQNNSPADPHGDRAYAAALVAPITTGTNEPPGYVTGSGGYVVLNSSGQIPNNLLPSAGGTTNFYDVRNSQFGATGNGFTDDSTAINNALAAAGTAGSGVVYIPAGTYGIGSSLYIQNGTLLLLAPGATIQRVSPVSAPTVMLRNYAPGIAAGTGNFTIMGGKWDAVGTTNQTSTNTIFSFVNAGQVIIENTILNQLANGASSYGQFFGCNNVTVYGVTLTATAPTCTRAQVLNPCFRVEQTHATNIPGLVAGDYNHQMCNGVDLINCSLTCPTSSDSNGIFSAWHSLCGTIGYIDSASLFHQNILVNICNATAFANTGIYGYNWNNVVYTGCNFNNPLNNSFVQIWVSSAPSPIIWTTSSNDQNGVLVASGNLTTTLTGPVTAVTCQVLKGYTYTVKAWALLNGSSTSQHFSYGLSGASGTATLGVIITPPGGGGNTISGGVGYGSFNVGASYLSSGNYVHQLYGTFTASATGNVNLQFGTSGGTLTVVGCTLELIPVPA